MNGLATIFCAAVVFSPVALQAAAPDTANINADSVKFRSDVRREVIRVLRELGVKTPEDTAASDTVKERETTPPSSSPSIESHAERYSYPPSVPGPYFDWQSFSDLRYNRVDGLFLGIGNSTPHLIREFSKDIMEFDEDDNGNLTFALGNLRDSENVLRDTAPPDDWRVTEGLGYAFGSHFWTVEGSISRILYFGGRGAGIMLNAIELGADGHIRTDTRDAWLVDVDENTTTSLVAREDFQDYFKRSGFSIFGAWHIGKEHLTLTYRNDRYNALVERDYWTLFGGKKVFRPNPPITEGVIPSAVVTSYFTTKPAWRNCGWRIYGEAEFGAGDYKFNVYTLDLRRYQPLTYFMEANARLYASAATGNIPLQDYDYVGGISTLPAYDYKEFAGNRALLLNLEWGFATQAFGWFLDRSMIFLLADAGYAYVTEGNVTQGWNGMSVRNMKTDLGVAYGTRNGGFRIGVVWRNDRNDGAKFFIRFSRPF